MPGTANLVVIGTRDKTRSMCEADLMIEQSFRAEGKDRIGSRLTVGDDDQEVQVEYMSGERRGTGRQKQPLDRAC
jgi:hypothetical protein